MHKTLSLFLLLLISFGRFSHVNEPPVANAQNIKTKKDTPLKIKLTGTDLVGGFESSTWTQRGADINGEAAGDYSGFSVSLSSDGTTLAVGAEKNDGNGKNSGHVRVYKYNGTTWTQRGADIDGEAADDRSGWSVSLSSDGTTVAIGAPANAGNGTNSGHVRVFNFASSVNSPPVANDQSLKTYTNNPLEIKLTGSDPEDDPLTYLIKTLPSNGILKEGANTILLSELPKLLPADSLTYVPNTNFAGNDSFDFIINANFLNSFTKSNGLKYITQDGVPVTYQKPAGETYFLIQNET